MKRLFVRSTPTNIYRILWVIVGCLGSFSAKAQSPRDLISEYQYNEFRQLPPATLSSDFSDISRTPSKLIYTGGSRSGCLALTERMPFQISSNAAVMGTTRLSVKVLDYLSQPGFCSSCQGMCEVQPECEPPVYSPSAKTYQFRVELTAKFADGTQFVRTNGVDNGPSFFQGTQSFSGAELTVPPIRAEKQIDWVQMKVCDIRASDNGAKARLEISVENIEIAKFWD